MAHTTKMYVLEYTVPIGTMVVLEYHYGTRVRRFLDNVKFVERTRVHVRTYSSTYSEYVPNY